MMKRARMDDCAGDSLLSNVQAEAPDLGAFFANSPDEDSGDVGHLELQGGSAEQSELTKTDEAAVELSDMGSGDRFDPGSGDPSQTQHPASQNEQLFFSTKSLDHAQWIVQCPRRAIFYSIRNLDSAYVSFYGNWSRKVMRRLQDRFNLSLTHVKWIQDVLLDAKVPLRRPFLDIHVDAPLRSKIKPILLKNLIGETLMISSRTPRPDFSLTDFSTSTASLRENENDVGFKRPEFDLYRYMDTPPSSPEPEMEDLAPPPPPPGQPAHAFDAATAILKDAESWGCDDDFSYIRESEPSGPRKYLTKDRKRSEIVDRPFKRPWSEERENDMSESHNNRSTSGHEDVRFQSAEHESAPKDRLRSNSRSPTSTDSSSSSDSSSNKTDNRDDIQIIEDMDIDSVDKEAPISQPSKVEGHLGLKSGSTKLPDLSVPPPAIPKTSIPPPSLLWVSRASLDPQKSDSASAVATVSSQSTAPVSLNNSIGGSKSVSNPSTVVAPNLAISRSVTNPIGGLEGSVVSASPVVTPNWTSRVPPVLPVLNAAQPLNSSSVALPLPPCHVPSFIPIPPGSVANVGQLPALVPSLPDRFLGSTILPNLEVPRPLYFSTAQNAPGLGPGPPLVPMRMRPPPLEQSLARLLTTAGLAPLAPRSMASHPHVLNVNPPLGQRPIAPPQFAARPERPPAYPNPVPPLTDLGIQQACVQQPSLPLPKVTPDPVAPIGLPVTVSVPASVPQTAKTESKTALKQCLGVMIKNMFEFNPGTGVMFRTNQGSLAGSQYYVDISVLDAKKKATVYTAKSSQGSIAKSLILAVYDLLQKSEFRFSTSKLALYFAGLILGCPNPSIFEFLVSSVDGFVKSMLQQNKIDLMGPFTFREYPLLPLVLAIKFGTDSIVDDQELRLSMQPIIDRPSCEQKKKAENGGKEQSGGVAGTDESGKSGPVAVDQRVAKAIGTVPGKKSESDPAPVPGKKSESNPDKSSAMTLAKPEHEQADAAGKNIRSGFYTERQTELLSLHEQGIELEKADQKPTLKSVTPHKDCQETVVVRNEKGNTGLEIGTVKQPSSTTLSSNRVPLMVGSGKTYNHNSSVDTVKGCEIQKLITEIRKSLSGTETISPKCQKLADLIKDADDANTSCFVDAWVPPPLQSLDERSASGSGIDYRRQKVHALLPELDSDTNARPINLNGFVPMNPMGCSAGLSEVIARSRILNGRTDVLIVEKPMVDGPNDSFEMVAFKKIYRCMMCREVQPTQKGKRFSFSCQYFLLPPPESLLPVLAPKSMRDFGHLAIVTVHRNLGALDGSQIVEISEHTGSNFVSAFIRALCELRMHPSEAHTKLAGFVRKLIFALKGYAVKKAHIALAELSKGHQGLATLFTALFADTPNLDLTVNIQSLRNNWLMLPFILLSLDYITPTSTHEIEDIKRFYTETTGYSHYTEAQIPGSYLGGAERTANFQNIGLQPDNVPFAEMDDTPGPSHFMGSTSQGDADKNLRILGFLERAFHNTPDIRIAYSVQGPFWDLTVSLFPAPGVEPLCFTDSGPDVVRSFLSIVDQISKFSPDACDQISALGLQSTALALDCEPGYSHVVSALKYRIRSHSQPTGLEIFPWAQLQTRGRLLKELKFNTPFLFFVGFAAMEPETTVEDIESLRRFRTLSAPSLTWPPNVSAKARRRERAANREKAYALKQARAGTSSQKNRGDSCFSKFERRREKKTKKQGNRNL